MRGNKSPIPNNRRGSCFSLLLSALSRGQREPDQRRTRATDETTTSCRAPKWTALRGQPHERLRAPAWDRPRGAHLSRLGARDARPFGVAGRAACWRSGPSRLSILRTAHFALRLPALPSGLVWLPGARALANYLQKRHLKAPQTAPNGHLSSSLWAAWSLLQAEIWKQTEQSRAEQTAERRFLSPGQTQAPPNTQAWATSRSLTSPPERLLPFVTLAGPESQPEEV